MRKKISSNLKDTGDIAKAVAKKILSGFSKKKARVIGLYGDLGAGKTAFTKALGRELGIREKIISPTFIIMKKFKLKTKEAKSYKLLIHIDAYRLKKGEELKKLGWAEIISDPQNLVLIEWPEQVKDVMPKGHDKIKIRHLSEKSREFEICM
jgi:tRNA threonylcarbamoyladenosine biosynthesis protein TsaE